ncbi:MAG: murein L,D-transpeptidase catalytic domain family protein [Bergeyella sp.]
MNKLVFLFLLISFLGYSQEKQFALPESKISEIKNFVKGSKYNQDIAFFINFKIASGKYRFFIYDLKNGKILEKGIVSHGSGSVVKNSTQLAFSNTENSYQSSLGKYEIANSYVGTFGKSYRLKGLDKTNSNAMKRAIVLHSLDCVPDSESENPACLSLGCPMLSPKFFTTTAKYIDSSKKTIVLYAFY